MPDRLDFVLIESVPYPRIDAQVNRCAKFLEQARRALDTGHGVVDFVPGAIRLLFACY